MQGKERLAMTWQRSPCHTCLPQAQCTVSVGRGLVSCCLQTGQGLAIVWSRLGGRFRTGRDTSALPVPNGLTLTNTGNGTLLTANIKSTSQFKQTNNCPASLDPQASCTFNVRFRPTDKGGPKWLGHCQGQRTWQQQVPLSGTGTFVQLIPARLNFGGQPVGTKSLPRKITLTNKGDAAVNISDISITGADPRDFKQTNNCGGQVASGASCFIKVTFKLPLVKGKRTADVSVSDDGGGSPQKVALSGTGT